MSRGKTYTGQFDEGGFGITPDAHLNYRLIGDWQKANFLLQRFPFIVTKATNLATRSFVRDYRKKVIENINNNGASIGWEPIVSKKYRQFKKRHSSYPVDSHWRFFGELLNNISVYKSGVMGWSAGIKGGAENSQMQSLNRGKLDISEYAGVLEHGSSSRNIRARPLWNPSYRQIGGNLGLMKKVAIYLRAALPSARLKLPRS